MSKIRKYVKFISYTTKQRKKWLKIINGKSYKAMNIVNNARKYIVLLFCLK